MQGKPSITTPAASTGHGSVLRVLLVDDEESILLLMRDILQEGYAVDMAASGYEALGLLGEHAYDVVVTDWRMPGLTGQDIYVWLKENRSGEQRRLIFMTGDVFDPLTKEFIDETGNVCLAKPFTVVSLREAVARVAQLTDAPATEERSLVKLA